MSQELLKQRDVLRIWLEKRGQKVDALRMNFSKVMGVRRNIFSVVRDYGCKVYEEEYWFEQKRLVLKKLNKGSTLREICDEWSKKLAAVASRGFGLDPIQLGCRDIELLVLGELVSELVEFAKGEEEILNELEEEVKGVIDESETD